MPNRITMMSRTDVLIMTCFAAVFVGILASPIIPMAIKNTIIMKAHAQTQTQTQTQTQPETTASTNAAALNFTKLITAGTEKFMPSGTGSSGPIISVLYESPKLVVMEGYALMMPKTTIEEMSPGNGLPANIPPTLDNTFIWRAVDIMKQHGFDIETMVTSGLSSDANPLVYHIVFSHK